LRLDEESLTSREKLTEEVKINKTVDIETPSKQELAQQKIHKVSVKDLEAWFGTKQALKTINLDIKEKIVTAFIGP
jgi:phosphate transport system ATP-binding protein